MSVCDGHLNKDVFTKSRSTCREFIKVVRVEGTIPSLSTSTPTRMGVLVDTYYNTVPPKPNYRSVTEKSRIVRDNAEQRPDGTFVRPHRLVLYRCNHPPPGTPEGTTSALGSRRSVVRGRIALLPHKPIETREQSTPVGSVQRPTEDIFHSRRQGIGSPTYCAYCYRRKTWSGPVAIPPQLAPMVASHATLTCI